MGVTRPGGKKFLPPRTRIVKIRLEGLHQSNSKKYWQIINYLTQRTERNETTEPDKMSQEKANNFNKYFATVGEEIQKKLKK